MGQIFLNCIIYNQFNKVSCFAAPAILTTLHSTLWRVTSQLTTRESLPIELFDALMQLTSFIFPNESERTRTVVGLINDIKAPIEVCYSMDYFMIELNQCVKVFTSLECV